MTRYSDSVKDQNGTAIEGASVYVYTYAGDLADLEQDGGGSLANPVTTDQYGGFYFNADDGLYTLKVHYDGRQVAVEYFVQVGVGPALPADIVAALAQSSASAGIGYMPPGTGAVARTVEDKLQDLMIDIGDYAPLAAAGFDCTAAFQSAINAGSVRFRGPGGYVMSYTATNADLVIPNDRKILIEVGADVQVTGARLSCALTGGRNIEFEVNGTLRSVEMRTAASRPTWTAEAFSRGFIEFGEPYVAGSAASGFKVHGNGSISGDWTGTPNFDEDTFQINRKGIAAYNSRNVYVSGLEVFGFDGEAIYAFNPSGSTVFERNYVHDTRFNALNFNAGPDSGGGCVMKHNVVDTAYQVEANVGLVTDNSISNTIGDGIYTGNAGGAGPIRIARNTITNAGRHGISTDFDPATPVSHVAIEHNWINGTGQYGIYTDHITDFVIRGNTTLGVGQSSGGYGVGVNNAERGRVEGNTTLAPGAFFGGPIAVDAATCVDVSVDTNTNVKIATTGTAPPYVGNGVQSVASAATVTLPTLGSIFTITGTTNITSLTATGNAGRAVTLIFAGVLTFTDGSNLKLAGNLTTAANTTISLLCDGTNWVETGRSVN